MIFHIVKQNETIKDLMFRYGLDKSEIISNNQHISDWDTLIPGVKLKIPVVNNNLYEHLEEVEPFIEDYYPKDSYNVNEPVYVNDESKLINDEIYQINQSPEEVNQVGDISEPVQEVSINVQPQETNQTGDITAIVQDQTIENSNPEESQTVSQDVVMSEQPQDIETQEVLQPETTQEDMNINEQETEVTQQQNQYVQQVNSQVQNNNIKYPVYYRINPYYTRRVYYDPYRKKYFYF